MPLIAHRLADTRTPNEEGRPTLREQCPDKVGTGQGSEYISMQMVKSHQMKEQEKGFSERMSTALQTTLRPGQSLGSRHGLHPRPGRTQSQGEEPHARQAARGPQREHPHHRCSGEALTGQQDQECVTSAMLAPQQGWRQGNSMTAMSKIHKVHLSPDKNRPRGHPQDLSTAL